MLHCALAASVDPACGEHQDEVSDSRCAADHAMSPLVIGGCDFAAFLAATEAKAD
jgi:hypothetical protein